jgi:hypothetical protein
MAGLDCKILVTNQTDIVTSIGVVPRDAGPEPGKEAVADSQLLVFHRTITAIM